MWILNRVEDDDGGLLRMTTGALRMTRWDVEDDEKVRSSTPDAGGLTRKVVILDSRFVAAEVAFTGGLGSDLFTRSR
jgi:hypothetical protein